MTWRRRTKALGTALTIASVTAFVTASLLYWALKGFLPRRVNLSSSTAIENEGEPSKAIEEQTLSSRKLVDYGKLNYLLSTSKLKEADTETRLIFTEIAVGDRSQSLSNLEEVSSFPCTDLQTIEYLWSSHSDGRFGLQARRDVYRAVGGQFNYNRETYQDFASEIGYFSNGSYKEYSSLNFTKSAPKGALPMFDFHCFSCGVEIFSRMEECGL